MANETLVSIPTKFEDFKQIRSFLVRLIEKLDVVLGFRGNVTYEEAGIASNLNTNTLTTLNSSVEELKNTLDSLDSRVTVNETNISNLSTTTTITDLTYTAPTISPAYVQAEVQGLADDIESVSDKLDEVLAVLRTVEVIN